MDVYVGLHESEGQVVAAPLLLDKALDGLADLGGRVAEPGRLLERRGGARVPGPRRGRKDEEPVVPAV